MPESCQEGVLFKFKEIEKCYLLSGSEFVTSGNALFLLVTDCVESTVIQVSSQ